MIKKTLVVNEEHGLHARPSAKISKVCRDLDSKVTFSKNAKTADGKSILQMLLLAAEQGAIIEVVVEGGDEAAAMNRITELFEHGAGI
jgi:phosphotransferase system HPr (HPr) family protein